MMFQKYISEIKKHAREDYPNEACGLILKSKGYVRCDNIHTCPRESFRIDPKVIIEHGDDILCVVHSHPDGPDYPSEADMGTQIAMGVPWGICTVYESACFEPFFFGDGADKQPLVGRGFRHGVSDCYSLIRDYYEEEFNEHLPEIKREWEWWRNGGDLYQDFLESAGFEYVNVGNNPRKGDICFFAIKSDVPNHAGIYLGNGLVLHHLSGRAGSDMNALSRREPILRWMDSCVFWARYKAFR